MKRRGFLAFLGGGAIAGPSMVKAAAAQTMADLSVPGVGIGWSDFEGLPPSLSSQSDDNFHLSQLTKLMGMSSERHQQKIRQRGVHTLDPDLASYRSMSLSWKLRQQRERDYWREYHNQTNWLQRIIAGEDA